MITKPYSESCDQNCDPILQVIQPLFQGISDVLEIGSGTGQHAVYFAGRMPHLVWHTSDCEENHPGIRAWLEEAGLDNVRPPLALDVTQGDWPQLRVGAVFSANTTHIMAWPEVEAFFSGVGRLLSAGGLFTLYGPFSYGGEYTSDSNRMFDVWLRQRGAHMGIRAFEALDRLAATAGMRLQQDYPMPANNRILCWVKREGWAVSGSVP